MLFHCFLVPLCLNVMQGFNLKILKSVSEAASDGFRDHISNDNMTVENLRGKSSGTFFEMV